MVVRKNVVILNIFHNGKDRNSAKIPIIVPKFYNDFVVLCSNPVTTVGQGNQARAAANRDLKKWNHHRLEKIL